MMAHFPNGTSFDFFYEGMCEKCVHEPVDMEDHPEDGCPIILAHELYSYDLCNNKEHPGKVILDLLIPMREDCQADDCRLFHARDGVALNPWQMNLDDAT